MHGTSRIAVVASAALLAAAAAAISQDPPKADPGSEIAALEQAHRETTLDYRKAYDAFRPKFEAFAAAHTTGEPAASARLWLLEQSWWLRQGGKMEATADPLAETLLADHLSSPQLWRIPEAAYVISKDRRLPLFRRLLEGSPHGPVRAAALFAIAQATPADAEGGAARRALLERLATEYGTVAWHHSTYGAIADAHLHPHPKAALAVGQTAPEIEGIEVDGAALRLSSFRGQVVLLDFWGDW